MFYLPSCLRNPNVLISHRKVVVVRAALCSVKDSLTNLAAFSYCFSSEPEVAWVGLTEQQARERHGCIEIAHYDYAVEPRAQIFDEMQGFIRLIFACQTSRLVGAQVVGSDAAQVIASSPSPSIRV